MESEEGSSTVRRGGDNKTTAATARSSSSLSQENVVWEDLDDNFVRVQRILDENRVLIGEINQNHESKMPENLTRNVGLIKELNSNISQVVGLYSDMSTSFAHSMDVHQSDLHLKGNTTSIKQGEGAGSAGQKRSRPT